MGGGDLNLKKSWHPSTLRNIERVWKAEQVRDMEKSKIEQLQKELMEERSKQEMRQFAEDTGVVKKRQDRLDWMYQGVAGLVDRDQYLMGRKVDKNFEILQQEEEGIEQQDEDQLPGAVFAASSANAVVDLGNKIREDPLFEIKKQEMKTKKTLLSNPVKMKYLREMLEESLKSKKKNKKKKHKKKKDKSDDSFSDSDKEMKITNEKHRHKHKHHSHEEEASTSNHSKHHRTDRENRQENHHRYDERNEGRNGREHKCASREERGKHRARDSHKLTHTREGKHPERGQESRDERLRTSPSQHNYLPHSYHHKERRAKRRHDSESDDDERESRKKASKPPGRKPTRHNSSSSDESTHEPSRTQARRSQKDQVDSSSDDEPQERNDTVRRYRSMTDTNGAPKFGLIKRGSPPRKVTPKPPQRDLPAKKEEKKTPVAHKRRALTEEEKEEARRQMLENAQWREGQRKTIVDRYRKDEENEEIMHKQGGKGGFIRPMLSKAAETGTVESRIKQKMHTVQRNRDAMDRNFARK
ncbi:pre-mRNA-splicing factor CWC25 homolog [Ornithodoros turicata]|uniref:pre-mRNA-splicing factor CWC25 homolog n=1 Tax=Ornithodoros turicata TaxID=34597 RepID=UPI0031399135